MRDKERIAHVLAGVSLAIFIVLGIASGASAPAPVFNEAPPNANEIGTIQVNFETRYPRGNIPRNNAAAYTALLRAAIRTHGEDVYVVNITWTHIGRGQGGRGFRYSARGTVVQRERMLTGIEGALTRAAESIARYIPANSRIALAYIYISDTDVGRGYAALADGRLEHLFRLQGFDIFDRSQLDIIQREQQLGLDFVVDQQTAISIGRITGVTVIITGRVVVAGGIREFQLRALDTTTARLVGTAIERF